MPGPKFLGEFIVTWVCIELLRFSYGWLPNIFFQVIAETNETVFFQMKIAIPGSP